MPQAATDAVRAVFEAAARVKDPAGECLDALDPETRAVIFEFFDPAIELREDPRFPEGGLYRGIDETKGYFEQFTESFDEFVFDAAEFLPVGDDRVLMQFRLRMRGRESGVPAEVFPGWIYTIRDGTVVKLEAYLDRDEARRVAGLA